MKNMNIIKIINANMNSNNNYESEILIENKILEWNISLEISIQDYNIIQIITNSDIFIQYWMNSK